MELEVTRHPNIARQQQRVQSSMEDAASSEGELVCGEDLGAQMAGGAGSTDGLPSTGFTANREAFVHKSPGRRFPVECSLHSRVCHSLSCDAVSVEIQASDGIILKPQLCAERESDETSTPRTPPRRECPLNRRCPGAPRKAARKKSKSLVGGRWPARRLYLDDDSCVVDFQLPMQPLKVKLAPIRKFR